MLSGLGVGQTPAQDDALGQAQEPSHVMQQVESALSMGQAPATNRGDLVGLIKVHKVGSCSHASAGSCAYCSNSSVPSNSLSSSKASYKRPVQTDAPIRMHQPCSRPACAYCS